MKAWTERLLRCLIAFAAVLSLAACEEGMGVVATDDPHEMLAQAHDLDSSGRVMRARQQVEKAIPILKARNDKAGLADAYRLYGFIAGEGGLGADPAITRDPRAPIVPTRENAELAIGYFEQAVAFATEADEPDRVSNIYFILGNYASLAGDLQKGCRYYDLSLKASQDAQSRQPGLKVELPAGFRNFGELVARAKHDAHCP